MKDKSIIGYSVISLSIILIAVTLLVFPAYCAAKSIEIISPTSVVAKATTSSMSFVGSIILYVGSPDALVNNKEIHIDENPAVVPFIENSRTLMPLRFVANTLGFTVDWHETDRSITLKQSDIILEFALGSKIMKKNGATVEMETAAIAKNGRTLVPIFYVAQALGINVSYHRGLIILDSEKTYSPTMDKEYINSLIVHLSGIPIVGTAENFNALMKDFADEQKKTTWSWYDLYGSNLAFGIGSADSTITDAARKTEQDSIAALSVDHSMTNIQVEGVDEADIVKTDGEYIYHLSRGTLKIIQIDKYGYMKQVCYMDIPYHGNGYFNFDQNEQIYVDGDRLCIVGSGSVHLRESEPDLNGSPLIYSHYNGKNTVNAAVFDISDKSAPKLVREFITEGRLINSRKVDNILYLMSTHYMDFYSVNEPCEVVPLYYDSASAYDNKPIPLDYGSMRYFPGCEAESMLIICGIDIFDNKTEAQTSSILGSGNMVHMSRSALYIAKYSYAPYLRIMPTASESASISDDIARDATTFFKFALDNGYAIYQGKGEADGAVLNQYSLDEYNGFFRAAMTVNTINGGNKNALNIFDAAMNLCGSVTDMAAGEQIYAARFMGPKAFMVTFRTIDPLFALDLSNPYDPKVLGEVKIPGFSSYLHPYDENHLIGFGRETEEYTTTDSKGNIVDVRAVNRGLKLALYDISDMTNPKELYAETIGGESTTSELQKDPKALLFSKEKGFIAFPVDFQGIVYVFDISPNGIKLRGQIVPQSSHRSLNAGSWSSVDSIRRILYIGETFYSFTEMGIHANDISNLRLIRFLKYE